MSLGYKKEITRSSKSFVRFLHRTKKKRHQSKVRKALLPDLKINFRVRAEYVDPIHAHFLNAKNSSPIHSKL